MKPFTRSSKAGFTLVELIIVIAILAILAGVAVPVYSGYIKKANQAADLQLLSAVNTSFAAACTEVGIGPTDVTAAALRVANGCITGVSVSGFRAGVTPIAAQSDSHGFFAALSAKTLSATDAKAKISGAFQNYFGDNAATELKYYEGAGNFGFNPVTGCFEAYENGSDRQFVYIDQNGNARTLTVNTDDLNQYSASTFSVLGTSELTGAIDTLTDKAMLFTSALTAGNEDFEAFFNSLGLDTSQMSEEELNAAKTNALVLWAAADSEKLKDESYFNLLSSGSALISLQEAGTAKDVAALSLEYAMMMAYVHSDYATDIKVSDGKPKDIKIADINGGNIPEGYNSWSEYATATGGTYYPRNGGYIKYPAEPVYEAASDYFDRISADLMKIYQKEDGTYGYDEAFTLTSLYSTLSSSEGWADYMTNQGHADYNGYLSAMSAINGNTDNINLDQLLQNGYADPEFTALLTLVLGS